MSKCIGLIAGRSGGAITSELHKSGYEVAIVCGNLNEKGAETADYLFVQDLRQKERIAEFFKDKDVKHVILGTGHRLAIEIGHYLEENGFLLNLNLAVVEFCKNKYNTNNYLRSKGLRTPKSILLHKDDIEVQKAIEEASLPIVLKSIKDIEQPQLISKRNILEKEIRDLFEQEEELMLEEYIKGSDCTVVICSNAKSISIAKCIYFSKGKDHYLPGFEDSQTYRLESPIEDEVVVMAKKAILDVGAKGLARVDFIVKDGKKPYILEINTVIVSAPRDNTLTFRCIQGRINRAKELVQTALEEFGLPNDRKPLIGYYYSDKPKSLGTLQNAELASEKINSVLDRKIKQEWGNLRIDFSKFLNANNYIFDNTAKEKMLKLIIYVMKGNYDYIINDLEGVEKEQLDIVIDYLNIERYEG